MYEEKQVKFKRASGTSLSEGRAFIINYKSLCPRLGAGPLPPIIPTTDFSPFLCPLNLLPYLTASDLSGSGAAGFPVSVPASTSHCLTARGLRGLELPEGTWWRLVAAPRPPRA